MLFLIYEMISIIVNNSHGAIMRIILNLIESLYVGLQCVGRCHKLLNPGITIVLEIIEIIQDIMRIILFFQLNMWLGFIMRPCLVIPKLLALLDTYQS
jgi:hypothetical protein